MASNDSAIGRCPHCDRELTSAHLLIKYETESGDRGIFAECLDCGDVVSPE